MLRFVVDRNIPLAREAFGPFGEVTPVATGEITSARVRDADILIIRSETKVDRSLLEGSTVKFVGTTTIGIDHLDTAYLQSAGVAYDSAPGCNANSVKEYLVAALLFLSVERSFANGKTLGVVGVGNVGSRVAAAARALGLTVLENDPPLARSTGDPRYLPLDDLMDCDIVSLHVPLTRTGQDPTYHLFDERRLRAMKKGAVLINTSRGAVVETSALQRVLEDRHLSHAVIDVWEGEPAIDAGLLPLVTLGTPHIAGYSLDGKVNGVRMIRDAVCRHFGLAPIAWDPTPGMGKPPVTSATVPPDAASVEAALHVLVRECYDISLDDANLRRMTGMPPEKHAAYFAGLRSGYRVRREFSTLTVRLPRDHMPLGRVIAEIGFQCIEES